MRVAQERFSDAAERESLEPRPAMRADHEELRRQIFRRPEDGEGHGTIREQPAATSLIPSDVVIELLAVRPSYLVCERGGEAAAVAAPNRPRGSKRGPPRDGAPR